MNRKDDNLLRKLGKQIKIERTKKGLSQEKLGELSSLSRPTIGLIERGESEPSIVKVAQIAEALDIKLCDLLDFE